MKGNTPIIPVKKIFLPALLPLSLLYRLGFVLFRILTKSRSTGVPVISIGNITAGGTGKTPCVMKMLELFGRERKIAVLTRGYGRKTKGTYTALPADSADMIGDEARTVIGRFPDAILIAGSDRAVSAGTALDMGAQLIVLDDGFQSFELARDADIVMIDSTDPFGGGFLLPSGRLREPLASLKRAHCVILHRSDIAGEKEVARIKDTIRGVNPSVEIFPAHEILNCFMSMDGEGSRDPSCFAGRRILCFSAIGNPLGFYNLLEKYDAVIIDKIEKRDHYRWKKKDLDIIMRKAAREAVPVVTTEKDAARIDRPLPGAWYLQMDMAVDREGDLKGFIDAKLG